MLIYRQEEYFYYLDSNHLDNVIIIDALRVK